MADSKYRHMRFNSETVERFNSWIAKQDAKLSKSEALDALVDLPKNRARMFSEAHRYCPGEAA